MKSNFALLLVLFITGCGSDAVDATSTKIDETGGVAGTSTAEVGGDASTTPGGSSAVTPGGSSSTTTTTTASSGGSSSTTATTTTPGGSSSTTTTTTAAGNGQGGQGTQASGGSSQPGSGGSAPASGGSAVQASGGSSPQATGGSAPATGGKAGAGSGGTSSVGGRSNGAGGAVAGGTSAGIACNAANAATVCNAFQTCDAVTRTCTGPIPSSSVNCSGVVLGVQVFGYTSPTMPATTLDTRASCQAATVASTNPSTQNWCCSINKEYCVVRSDVDTTDCPNSGATAGKPYIYDCVNDTQGGKLLSSGCVKVAKTSASIFVDSGYCCATSTIE